MVSYAILDGRLHRQDAPAGPWTMLDEAETRAQLDRLSSSHLPTKAMIEAAAIALFDHDEDLNVAFAARCDAEGNRGWGDAMGRERDRWENHGAALQGAFRLRATAALTAAFALLRTPDSRSPTAEDRLPTAVPGADGADMFHHPV